jgi:hypothetical protein
LPALLLPSGETRWVSHGALAMAASVRGNLASARTHLEALVSAPDQIDELTHSIEQAFLKEPLNFRSMFLGVLTKGVVENQVGPSFASAWVRQQGKEGNRETWTPVSGFIDRLGEAAVPAVLEFLEQIGQSSHAGDTVPALIEQRGPWLSEHTLLWGKVGFALTRAGLHETGTQWLRGGEQRPDAQGWMLANLMVCLRETGHRAEASKVSLEVVRRGLRDKTWNWHVSQAAIGAAERGEYKAAQNLLALADTETLSGTWKVTHALAGGLCRVRAAPPREARRMFPEVHETLRRAAKTTQPTASLVSEYDGALNLMVEHCGVSVPRWKRSYPWRPPARRSSPYWWLTPLMVLTLARACQEFSTGPNSCLPAPAQNGATRP